MLLGLEKLGLSKLNIIGSSDIYENVKFQENIYSVINIGKNEQENLYFHEKVEFELDVLSVGIVESLELNSQIKKVLSGKINFYDNLDFLENINTEIQTAKDIIDNVDFLENINQNINPDLNIYENLDLDLIFNLNAKPSKNIIELIDFAEYINTEITGSNLEINQAKFNGSIARNQTLTINSSNYTAFLDYQNVIDKYSGEWIFITPETFKINIRPNASNLDIWIEYQELFL